MNRDLALRVFPPAVADSATAARAAGQGALEAHGLVVGQQPVLVAFRPPVASALARLQAAWAAELDRVATELAGLGDRAEAAADDYRRTDRLALASTPGG
ncbi:MAG TPA: hypothetical protein VIJ54_02895 [Actinomycetes bacterium]